MPAINEPHGAGAVFPTETPQFQLTAPVLQCPYSVLRQCEQAHLRLQRRVFVLSELRQFGYGGSDGHGSCGGMPPAPRTHPTSGVPASADEIAVTFVRGGTEVSGRLHREGMRGFDMLSVQPTEARYLLLGQKSIGNWDHF